MRRAAAFLTMSVCALLAACSIAWAGTYPIGACDRAPAEQNNSWQPFNSDIAHLVTGSECPPSEGGGEEAKTSGLYAADNLTGTGSAAAGASAGWSFTAPAGMSIVAFQPDRYLGAYGDSGWVPSITASGTTLESCTFSYPQDECALGGAFGNVNSLAGPIPVNNASNLTVAITCTGNEGCVPGATIHHAWAALYGATVTLSETATPTLSAPTGSLWAPGAADGFHKGIESVSFGASDPSGISQAVLSVDGHTVASQSGVCDYTYPVPCQSLTGTLDLDTTQLADGAHAVTLAVYDAAQNETQSTTQIVVDNTAPAPPTGLTASRTPDGSDSVTWSNPPHVAPITQATYQLCPLPAGACQPPQGTADQESLVELHPPPGRWQLKMWLADATGNVNPANAASVELPAPLTLHIHHQLKSRRLTVYALVPQGVLGPVNIGYQALRGTRILEHGDRGTIVRHHEARITVRLTARAAAHVTRLNLTARASYALPARQLISVARRRRR
jgi:hypothetical protein